MKTIDKPPIQGKSRYYFVFCTRYRRKIFFIPGVTTEMYKTTSEVCSEHNVDIASMWCVVDYVHIILDMPIDVAPADIVRKIKSKSSRAIRDGFTELSKMPSLWTNNLLTSIEPLTDAQIYDFVWAQKKRS